MNIAKFSPIIRSFSPLSKYAGFSFSGRKEFKSDVFEKTKDSKSEKSCLKETQNTITFSIKNTPKTLRTGKRVVNSIIVLDKKPQSLGEVCQVLIPDEQEFYKKENGAFALGNQRQAVIASHELRVSVQEKEIKRAVKDIADLIGDNTNIRMQLLAEDLKDSGNFELLESKSDLICASLDEETRQKFLSRYNDICSDIEYNNKLKNKIDEFKNGEFELNTPRDISLRGSKSIFYFDSKRNVFVIKEGKLKSYDAIELTVKNLYEYSNIIKDCEFIDGDIDIMNPKNSSNRALHSMHRLIGRYGKDDEGKIDLSLVKSFLDNISAIISNNSDELYNGRLFDSRNKTPKYGVYIALGKSSRGAVSLIVPKETENEYSLLVFDKDTKLITAVDKTRMDVLRSFCPVVVEKNNSFEKKLEGK